ncbi:MAG: hypothetical protein KGZ81_07290 [Flavobacteriales bacterium]|nr:hypothetical protein [Flavobacteriales bacterium]
MRELKFRAYVQELNRMTYFHLDKDEGIVHDDETLESNQIFTISEPLQYTGIKDDNGVEIYEGDIVKAVNYIGVVEWFDDLKWDGAGSNHPGFYCKEWFEYDDPGELSYHYGFDDCEVVGNIYQNPELIKGEKK